ncbi:hypothetical protein [Pseudomonas sp. MH10]|uniref:hypothetical protein n=1 Tax=Pseudomonas sp. MH10 TaxID=3048627 RepID=UPI002AC9AED9|nr:hypothetical protein [Pseudomonas sp. MH10]MEB0042640.1 hypothetical protein [Pseudomonas sp. MH10]WPX63536.1 hypothetical protein RHM59_22065 [Pseudomonas sp. MH10]
MTDDLLPRLQARYPTLLGDVLLREIGCFPGWFQLLDDLCAALQNHLDAHPEVVTITVVRIKEKWGQLRFNFRGGDEVCRDLVDAAGRASSTVCEVCGSNGKLRLVSERWYGVRCLSHICWSPVPKNEQEREEDDR